MLRIFTCMAFCTFSVFLTGIQQAFSAPVVYVDETEFLNDLALLQLTPVHEGFEDDAAWADSRVNAVAEVSHLGMTWTANNPDSGVRTGTGPARTGNYGFYSIPHGSYTSRPPGVTCFTPGECGDGWRGTSVQSLMYAIGGWIHTNTPFAKVGLFLGEYPDNPVDFGETCDPPDSENCTSNSTIGTTSEFFGVIDTDGFQQFEYREQEGKLEIDGGDIKYIFADDFYFVLGDTDWIFQNGFE